MDAGEASALVSIVVVPRERFSLAPEALDRLLAETAPGYELIYVDAGSPPHVADALRERAARHSFPLIRMERMMSPNQARNLGLQVASRPYVAFVDNDTLVSAGWLEALVRCARETGATVVGPLYLQGPFEDDMVHMAGGTWNVSQRDGQKWAEADYIATWTKRSDAGQLIARHEVGFVEFHCTLVQRALLEKLGGLDESFLSTPEHVDLALVARTMGGSVYLEPDALVTYIKPDDIELFDLSYFMLRWCQDWNMSSLDAFASKWGYSPKSTFIVDQRDWTNQYGAHFGLALPAAAVARRTIPASSAVVAQTNIALYRQMQFEEYPAAAFEPVRKAYETAQRLFGALFRASGKPFLAHAVGTASVLASYRQPATLLAAALLHAAYSHGRFPSDVPAQARRDWLAQAVGPEVEKLVDAYHRHQHDNAIPDSAEQIGAMKGDAGIAVILGIANRIDDCVDGGEAFAQPQDRPDEARLAYWSAVAGILHLPGLARSLALAVAAPQPSIEGLRGPATFSYGLDSQGNRTPV